jgi:Skp family chaperone for outer membrane proteins
MVKHIFLALLAALFVAPAGFVAAQEKAESPPLPIGIVNIEKIAQQHKPFQVKVMALQEEGKELNASIALKQSEVQAVANDLQKAKPGSPEVQKLQMQVVRLQRELQMFVQENQQKFREKDLKLSLSLHREVDEVLKPYCKAKGLKLVVRTQNSSLDENQNPQQIGAALGRGVLYEDGLDITDDVLKLLTEKSAKEPK